MTDAELEALHFRSPGEIAAAVGAEIGAAIVDDPRILAGSRWTVRRVPRRLGYESRLRYLNFDTDALEVELVAWPGHVFRDDLVERALDGSPLAFLRATMPDGGRSPDLVAATDAVREIVARVARVMHHTFAVRVDRVEDVAASGLAGERQLEVSRRLRLRARRPATR